MAAAASVVAACTLWSRPATLPQSIGVPGGHQDRFWEHTALEEQKVKPRHLLNPLPAIGGNGEALD